PCAAAMPRSPASSARSLPRWSASGCPRRFLAQSACHEGYGVRGPRRPVSCGRRIRRARRASGALKPSPAMQILPTNELERLVRQTFPEKPAFSAGAAVGLGPPPWPIVTFVPGGADPCLDRPFEDWLRGAPVFVAAHQLLNRLCRAGALAPGEYAITRPHGPIPAGMRHRLG